MANSWFERAARRALQAAAVLWAVLVVAAPWVSSVQSPAGGAAHLSAATYIVGSLVCHQHAGRSFHLGGGQLPVCARCTGLYLSAALGIVFAWSRGRSRAPLPFAAWRWRLVLAALPTVVTVVVEWWQPALTSGVVRALAGAPLGFAAGVLLAESMSFQGRLEECERMRQSE